MSGRPLVSCVVAAYNYAAYLPRALDTALRQTYPADRIEIVVVDDGSTDGTPEVVRPYLDRVRYVRKEHGGLLSTVNRGLAEARGELIALLSADDEWPPDRLDRQVALLERRPEVGLVYGDMEVIDAAGRTLAPSYFAQFGIEPVRGRAAGALLSRNLVSGGALMVRASLKPHFHPVPEWAGWEDWWTAVRVARVAELDYVDGSVYRYRFHGANMNFLSSGEQRLRQDRAEIPFRRWLLSTTRPGEATVEELLHGLHALELVCRNVAAGLGVPPEELLPVDEDDRAEAREATARGLDALRRGETEAAAFALVAALARDPSAVEARAALERAVAPPPARLELEARAFAALSFASELVSAPELLAAYAGAFSAADDATLVIYAPDASSRELAALERAVSAAGLDGDGAPDLLAFTVSDDPSVRAALARRCRAVYTRAGVGGPLAALPRTGDAEALRRLAAR